MLIKHSPSGNAHKISFLIIYFSMWFRVIGSTISEALPGEIIYHIHKLCRTWLPWTCQERKTGKADILFLLKSAVWSLPDFSDMLIQRLDYRISVCKKWNVATFIIFFKMLHSRIYGAGTFTERQEQIN